MDNKLTVTSKLDEFLGLEAAVETQELVSTKPAEVESSGNPIKDMEDDFDFARKQMYSLIDKTNELVDNANFFAREKQDSRSVEAASMTAKEARENIIALINLRKTKAEIEKTSGSGNVGGDVNVTNNAVFVGSTGELLKHMKELKANGSLSNALQAIDVTSEPINSKE